MAIIQPPPLSDAVLQSIKRAEAMHGFIQLNILDSFPATIENVLVASLFSLAQEHHSAILYLLRTGQHDGSAFALIRPVIEACYRAHWTYACADAEKLERIRKGESYPSSIRNMAEEIEKRVDAGGLFLTIVASIRSLHGFTHGGLEQLERRFSPDGSMTPHFTDEEKQQAINMTTEQLTALAIAWCELIAANASKVISTKYGELYG